MFEKGILALLKEDHKQVRARLSKLQETTELREQQNLREQIAVDLRVHARIEEEIFYPAVERMVGAKKERTLVLQAYEDHDLAEKALQALLMAAPGTDAFRGHVKVLAQLVENHAKEEETDMFKQVKRNMDRERLEQLGEQAQRRKAELKGEIAAEVRSSTR